ncbi:MAG: hypothetical protein ACRDPM_04940 [Solirubrobacteraceae bacterium]
MYTGYTPDIRVTSTATAGHRGPGIVHGLIGVRERAKSAGSPVRRRSAV